MIDEVRISKVARYDRFKPPRDGEFFEPDSDTLALYHFDEGKGNELKDSSGNNHHGNIIGAKWVKADEAPPLPDAPQGFELEFDGKSSRVELPVIPFAPSDPLTVEAWFTALPGPKTGANDVVSKTDAIWGMIDPGTQSACHFVLDRPNDAWWFSAGNRQLTRATYYWFTRVDKRQDLYNTRHHVALVRDNGELRIYVDGEPHRSGGNDLDSNSFPANIRPAEIPNYFLGASVDEDGKSLNRFFQGSIDEFRLSRKVRYDQPFVPDQKFQTDADTLALYHFDEGSGETLKDSSGKNHHGKIIEAKWVKVDPTCALEFDGKDDYVSLPYVAYNFESPLTFEAWVTPEINQEEVDPQTPPFLWCRVGCYVALTRWGWQFFCHQRDVIHVHRKAQPGVRFHLVAQWDGKRCQMFVNGVSAISSFGEVKKDPMAILPRVIGAIGDWGGNPQGGYFRGQVEEIRISRVPRYQSDFTPPDPFEPFVVDEQTLALYHFDEASGEELKDSSGNGHHGKILGAKWVRVDRSKE